MKSSPFCRRLDILLNRETLIKSVLTIALLAIVTTLALNASFYSSSMIDAFMAMALAGAVVTLLVIQPSLVNVAIVASCGLVLAVLDFRVLHFNPRITAGLSFEGVGALAVLGTRTIWARDSDKERALWLYAFVPAVLFVASEYMASTLLDYTESLHPKTFDFYLYSVDCSLRVQFSFLLGEIFAAFPWLRFTGLLFYVALPLPMALVYSANLRLKGKNAFPVMLALLVTGPMGVLYYNMVPAAGPAHLFAHNFPWHPFTIEQARNMVLDTVPVIGARNAIPSLHMAWVLLVWWNSRGLSRWIRGIALAFVIFTVMATMGLGEHYFVDLVVAFPFGLMVQALCQYRLPFATGARRAAFLFGVFASLTWMGMVSFATAVFWISPLVPWLAVLATIGISSLLAHRLQSAEMALDRGQSELPTRARSVATGG